ncbi:MAG: hypothetical protein R3293_08730 [Candidatus Promineifilaceae bacterium]|nr:hypothetical protein [Candidatus Promineifilaceae bacterium]
MTKNQPNIPLLLLIFLVSMSLMPSAVFGGAANTGNIIDVEGQNDPEVDYAALEAALMAAQSGDTINLSGIFNLSQCDSALILDKNITITGPTNPNDDPSTAAQLYGCGPALAINDPTPAAGALTIQQIYFRNQDSLAILFEQSVNEVNILGNRFTGTVPSETGGADGRFAVGAAGLNDFNIGGTIVVEDNVVDFSDYPHNDIFVGDDNGFAFAAASASIVVRNNSITTLGEAVEIEGDFGQENTYLVEGNVIHTAVPPSPAGESSGSPGSVAEGKEGGHPAVIKIIASEGTFIIRNNDVTLTGLPNGVCIMATTLNDRALAGEVVNLIENNTCHLNGQLTALLGAWGQTAPFFEAASLSGTEVSGNVVTGNGTVGIAMVNRTLVSDVIGSVVNTGHNNIFRDNNFSDFNAENADIGLDSATYDNTVIARPGDLVIDLGQNSVLNQLQLLPVIGGGQQANYGFSIKGE